MRPLLRVIGLFGGIAVLLYGLLPQNLPQYLSGAAPYLEPRASDGQWIALLWLGVVLLALAIWATLPQLQSMGSRVNVRPGVLNVSLVFSLLFLVLAVQLLHSEFVYADSIYYRTETNTETGSTISNSRPVIQSLRVRRGDIVDRNNIALASSRQAENGLSQRTYPIAQQSDIRAFSNILGYSSSQYGYSGIELQWNNYLTGAQGQAFRSLTDDLYNRPHTGNNLQLTIDWRLQTRTWDILNQLGQGKPASAVVMDPRSGAILAMASTPGFDPGSLTLNPDNSDAAESERMTAAWTAINADENRPLINRPLQQQYVPGSTFKTLTAIGALENPDILRSPSQLDCPNEYQPDPNAPPVVNAVGPPNHPDQAPLASFITQGTGRPVDLSGVFAFSCNTAFGQLGDRLGQEKFVELAERFHIYLPQNAPERNPDFTDLPAAVSFLTSQNNFLATNLARADTGFGQGQLQVTPLQMALIGATVANDGVMPQPYLVEAVTDPADPSVVLYQHRQPRNLLDSRRLISSANAAEMRKMMREGVTVGFGKAANVNNSGGKSGSGETGVDGVIHAAFLAIAPVDAPRYVVYVQIENGRDGAGVGARTAGEILKAAFETLG